MAPGLPARVVILCVVLAGARGAHAEEERRKVAVIDLSGDPAATELRRQFYRVLLGHWALQPLDTAELDASLQGELLDEDKARIERAGRNRTAAEAALFDFNFATTRTEVTQGQRDLDAVAPTQVSTALYADLELQLAYASFNEHKLADMSRQLALVYRLSPKKPLDPARYAPEFIEAYEAAKHADEAAKRTGVKVTLEVKGEGRVWIDGGSAGTAPGTFDTTAGDHVVQVTGDQRETAGVAVTLPGPPIEFAPATASTELLIQRARLALSRVPDAAARAAAMSHLAGLLGVHDAVLIYKSEDDKLLVQTWRDREPGFSRPMELRNQKPIDFLAPLSPPKQAEPARPLPFTPPIVVVEKPWYQQRWVQGSIVTGTVAAIVGAILWARRDKFTNFAPGDIKSADAVAR
ncbi:MAG: hypothetical protein JWO36_7521 [Myxococcales bacterium]|nr:hypothetical protein [Myxococcales bacterium]